MLSTVLTEESTIISEEEGEEKGRPPGFQTKDTPRELLKL